MERDFAFLKKLNNDEIILPSDPQYADWKLLKTEYVERAMVENSSQNKENTKNTPTKWRYLLNPTSQYINYNHVDADEQTS